jgi:starch synthase
MSGLEIAFVTPESVPFAKTGGLADVSGALPKSLIKQGHSVKLFMPKYKRVGEIPINLKPVGKGFAVRVGDESCESELYQWLDADSGLGIYFIGNDSFFERSELYRDPETGKDYADNDERFIFFCEAVVRACKELDWKPDIFHANDWQSALVPAYLKTRHKDDPHFAGSRTVFTIHNMGYQGLFPAERFSKLGVEKSYFYPEGPFEFWGDVNFMKSGIFFADRITTVSPTYAGEIRQSDEFGKGLQGVLKQRSEHLSGILNGVDYEQWSPERDSLIPFQYHINNLSGKKKNKLELLHKCGLPIRMEHPMIGMISRLDIQKGFDLLEEIMDDLMSLDVQFVLLGTGDEKYHELFHEAEKRYSDKFKAFLMFDNKLAHLIEAGSDMFLMPSRYEPCGLNQMYSLRYGTVPIVRKTGGLADSVFDFDEKSRQGTGFVFESYDSTELLAAIKRAVGLFPRKRIWYGIIKQGMRQDFSWDKSAREYSDLYYRLINES